MVVGEDPDEDARRFRRTENGITLITRKCSTSSPDQPEIKSLTCAFLHVAVEIYPLVKTGGLADVVAALPVALAARGLDVRVLLPGMPAILNGVVDLKRVIRLGPAFGAAVITLRLGRLPDSGLLAYVIDAPFLYRRDGDPYLGPDGRDWKTIIGALLSSAGSQRIWLPANWIESWQPEVVHAHDWHAGSGPGLHRAESGAEYGDGVHDPQSCIPWALSSRPPHRPRSADYRC
jgi:hypothetical protein